jgi:urea transport system ATP-binding protein
MLAAENIDLYYGASHILRHVGIVAEKGTVTCVLGRNGVGKTSLMRAIIGLQPIRSGRILWEGEDITRLKPHERARRGIALVPQGREIFPRLSVEENLETGFAPLPRAKRSVPEEIFTLFPVLRGMLKRRGGDLSGGQQQQLAIARALASKPRVLLLDEPTEGIQPSIIKELAVQLRAIRDKVGLTIVVSEQVLSFALSVADRILVLARGAIVHESPRSAMNEESLGKLLSI